VCTYFETFFSLPPDEKYLVLYVLIFKCQKHKMQFFKEKTAMFQNLSRMIEWDVGLQCVSFPICSS